jgi:hypothetical protein
MSKRRVPDAVRESAPEPFVACFSLPKLIGWIAVSGVFAAPCLLLVPGLSGSAGPGGVLIGLFGLIGSLFFGGIAAVQALRLFDRRPQVVIHDGSIYVRPHGDMRIPLRSIKGVHTDAGRLSLTLHKPAKYPIESRHRRLIYRINGSAARGFFGDVWIWSNQLDHPRDAFLAAIAAHRPLTAFEQQLAGISG